VRVLYSFPDAVGKPGIGWVAFHQVRGLVEAGVEVTLLCTSVHSGFELHRPRRVVTTMAIGGMRLPHRALGIDRTFRYHDWRVARGLGRLRNEVDLIHCWPRGVIKSSVVARRMNLPVLREVPNTHTAHAFEVVEREHDALGLPMARGQTHVFDAGILALEEAEYRAADLLLVPSSVSERTFLDRGFAPDKLALHGYGFDPEDFRPDPLPRPEDAPLTVLFAARCEPRKGLHHALRAWHESGLAERGRLVVCGEFIPGYRELLEPLLSHASVECRGFVPDLAATMREADVFLLPSIEEGSALVTYAAQGCGCVPVVSDAAGARCTHLEDGLVHEAGDVPALSEHLRMLDRDRGLLRRLREATLQTAQSLTWRDATRELIAIYEQALDAHAPRPRSRTRGSRAAGA
jgi:glycosyltransferase involved in cell wall biosynthesis